jgi:AhpD family alkylhydroperoxidase
MTTATPLLSAPDQRQDFSKLAPAVFRAQLQLTRAAAEAFEAAALPEALYHLVKLRASQLNGCAYCIDMHSKDARHGGEHEDRLCLLDAWRESPHFGEQERAALALTEAITHVSQGHVSDEVWDAAAQTLTPEQIAAVIAAAVEINGWNRIAISTRMQPGEYQPS